MIKIENKVITCLDGKQRVFNSYGKNSISYNSYKDGKATGRTFIIKDGKYPKFVTKEMLFEAAFETVTETAQEAHIEEIAQPETYETTFETKANTGRIVGYMRISTEKDSQKFDRQEAQLLEAGAEVLYADRMSGAKRQRPNLDKMLEELQEGDTVLIVSIDRLSRSTKDLLEIVEIIKSKNAFLKSLNDSWLDTTSENPLSDFLLTVMGALGQMERQMITQRVKEGVKVAQAKGVKFGRPKVKASKVEYALELYETGQYTVKEITDITGVSKATLYRKIKEKLG